MFAVLLLNLTSALSKSKITTDLLDMFFMQDDC